MSYIKFEYKYSLEGKINRGMWLKDTPLLRDKITEFRVTPDLVDYNPDQVYIECLVYLRAKNANRYESMINTKERPFGGSPQLMDLHNWARDNNVEHYIVRNGFDIIESNFANINKKLSELYIRLGVSRSELDFEHVAELERLSYQTYKGMFISQLANMELNLKNTLNSLSAIGYELSQLTPELQEHIEVHTGVTETNLKKGLTYEDLRNQITGVQYLLKQVNLIKLGIMLEDIKAKNNQIRNAEEPTTYSDLQMTKDNVEIAYDMNDDILLLSNTLDDIALVKNVTIGHEFVEDFYKKLTTTELAEIKKAIVVNKEASKKLFNHNITRMTNNGEVFELGQPTDNTTNVTYTQPIGTDFVAGKATFKWKTCKAESELVRKQLCNIHYADIFDLPFNIVRVYNDGGTVKTQTYAMSEIGNHNVDKGAFELPFTGDSIEIRIEVIDISAKINDFEKQKFKSEFMLELMQTVYTRSETALESLYKLYSETKDRYNFNIPKPNHVQTFTDWQSITTDLPPLSSSILINEIMADYPTAVTKPTYVYYKVGVFGHETKFTYTYMPFFTKKVFDEMHMSLKLETLFKGVRRDITVPPEEIDATNIHLGLIGCRYSIIKRATFTRPHPLEPPQHEFEKVMPAMFLNKVGDELHFCHHKDNQNTRIAIKERHHADLKREEYKTVIKMTGADLGGHTSFENGMKLPMNIPINLGGTRMAGHAADILIEVWSIDYNEKIAEIPEQELHQSDAYHSHYFEPAISHTLSDVTVAPTDVGLEYHIYTARNPDTGASEMVNQVDADDEQAFAINLTQTYRELD